MTGWTIAGAIFGAVAAAGVIIQFVIAAATRAHGSIQVVLVRAEISPPNTQTYGVELHAMGNMVCSDLKLTPNPFAAPYDSSPVAYFDTNAAPVFRQFTFPNPRLPEYDYEPRIVCSWVAPTGFRPRVKALLVLPDTFQVFDLKRSLVFPWVCFWKRRSPVPPPSIVKQTAGTTDPLRAVGYEQ